MDISWKSYWAECGPSEATNESDLFKQVAHTVGKQPIPTEQVGRMLERIVSLLRLSRQDNLIDFCCGNGLFTYELALHVYKVTGIDFVDRNIRIAQKQKHRSNTSYIVGDVTAPLRGLVEAGCQSTKFLMHYSLAYFTPDQFSTILRNILDIFGAAGFSFLLTGIPNSELKWNFYNTPERRARHLENEKNAADTNDGLGRWWSFGEIEQHCSLHGLTVVIQNQPPELSNYRMDALVSLPPRNR